MRRATLTPPPVFMIADYLIENSFAVLYGPPASFKSFLAIDWALSVAHGRDWNGRPTAQGAVVYLAMEGSNIEKTKQILGFINKNYKSVWLQF